MGVCLSAPKATESGPPVTSARTFGVTPVKTAPSTRARGDDLVDVQLDTPKEAPPPRSQPTDDDATRHPSAGFGSFLQAKVTTPPESSPSNAIDRELVDAMADAVVSATRASITPPPPSRPPVRPEPNIAVVRDADVQLEFAPVATESHPSPAAQTEPSKDTGPSDETKHTPGELKSSPGLRARPADSSNETAEEPASPTASARAPVSSRAPSSEPASSSDDDSDIFEDSLSMIDMGPVSDSDEEASEETREEDPSARETGGGGGNDNDDEFASYGGGDDDPHSPRSAAAPPEDEGTETRVDDDTEPIGETDAVCIRSLVCRAIDAVVARSAAPDPPERAPSPAADATDEESEEEAEEEEEEEVPVDAYYDDVDDDAPPISPVPAAFASMTAAARVVPEDRGRDPEAPTPTSDPAARIAPEEDAAPEENAAPPAEDPSSSEYESSEYSDEDDEFDADAGPRVESTVPAPERTTDANLAEVRGRSKNSPPPTPRIRGYTPPVSPHLGSNPGSVSSRGVTPRSTRSGESTPPSSRGPYGWSANRGGASVSGGNTARSGASDWQSVVVLYTTSITTVRKTAGQCQRVKQTLANLGVEFLERDISMATAYKEELRRRLGRAEAKTGAAGLGPAGKPPVPLVVPCLFVDDEGVGSGETLDEAAASGALKALLEERGRVGAALGAGECAECGGQKLVVCARCDGSMRWVMRDEARGVDLERRCPWCNEVGMTECKACVPTFAHTAKGGTRG